MVEKRLVKVACLSLACHIFHNAGRNAFYIRSNCTDANGYTNCDVRDMGIKSLLQICLSGECIRRPFLTNQYIISQK